MSSIFDLMRERIENSVFCYDKDGGEGFVNKGDCECFKQGELCCQSYKDREQFHNYFKELIGFTATEKGYDEYVKASVAVRKEVINKADIEMKDSKWFKDNVIK